MNKYHKRINHPIPPVFDENSEILILGSFPSVKSREQGFFYGHPQNRFWKVTAAVFGEEVPVSIEEKREFLLRNHIALWDVIESCEIEGSADSSIKNVKVNDLSKILKNSRISLLFVNGKNPGAHLLVQFHPGRGYIISKLQGRVRLQGGGGKGGTV